MTAGAVSHPLPIHPGARAPASFRTRWHPDHLRRDITNRSHHIASISPTVARVRPPSDRPENGAHNRARRHPFPYHVMISLVQLAASRCPPSVRSANRQLDLQLRKHHMDLVKWKVAKTTVLSLSVIAFGIYAIQNGADAGLTMFATNVVVALIAGIEFSELAAALAEVDTEN